MNGTIRIVPRDEAHLRAHLEDFLIPLEEAFELAAARLAVSPRRRGWEHFDFQAPVKVGLSGLKRLRSWTRGDFWGRRRGRELPSHLYVGKKRVTRSLCVWGLWREDGSFLLHTIYPGKVAPREIHDPELALGELPASIAFWSRHAIIVEPAGWDA